MKLLRVAGATSQIWQIQITNSTTGNGLTGLVFNSAGLAAAYHRDTDTTSTAIALVTMTVGTFTSSGFKEVDATKNPGLYQFCPPNAALATGAASSFFTLTGAVNMLDLPIEVDLDPQVDVRAWLGIAVTAATAGIPDMNVKNINNVAAATPGATGGLFIAGSNAATTVNITGTWTGNLSGSVGSVVGLTASNLDTTVSSRMATYTQPTGFLAATFPSGTIANTTNITAGTITTATNLTNAPTAGDFTATMKTSLITAASASSPTLDWSKVTNQSSVVVLSNTIISETVNVNNILLGGITAASFASGVLPPNFSILAIDGLGFVTTNNAAGPTAAAIATAVWTDTTASDFTTAASPGISVFTGVAPGAANGLVKAGSNASITTTNLVLGAMSIGGMSNVSQTGDVYAALPAGFSTLTTSAITTAVLTTPMTESYAALHVVPTLAQYAFESRAILAENGVAGTTVTTHKIDGSTTAHTYTIDQNPSPTTITTAS